MPTRRDPRHPRLLHALLLFGVLCLLGVQALEAQHSHPPDDQVSQCGLCHSSTAAAASSGVQPAIWRGEMPHVPACAAATPAQSIYPAHSARGPPVIS